jgi:hypothetical protein
VDLVEHGAIVVAPVDLVTGLHDDEGAAGPRVVRVDGAREAQGAPCAR